MDKLERWACLAFFMISLNYAFQTGLFYSTRKMVHVWNLSTSRRAFLVVAFNADLYPFQPDVLSECVRYICSEADKLLEPSPETLDRKSTGNPFGVADTTPRPHQPEPQTSEGVIDENQAIWGQVALSFMTQQTTQLLTLREMLKDLRPIMERLGIRGKAWHDFEILFLCSNPEEAARTYDMIKKQLSSDRPSEIPSTRPP